MPVARPSRTLLQPGADIGRCRIVRHLGSGGMGDVYLAEHRLLEKQVAVKVLPPNAAGKHQIERFLKEARVASRIEHPNVVIIHDVGDEAGLYYIVMQYIDGQNIAHLVQQRRQPLPWREALRIVRFAGKGLHAVHRQQVIHRDVKPANIMLSRAGRVVLMDFGLVYDYQSSDQTGTGTIVGTPSFMSPEQCRGQRLDLRSDVYSLGSTLYYLLAGCPPFQGSVPEVLSRIGSGELPRPLASLVPQVPPEVARLISKAMAAKAQDRFPDAETMSRQCGELAKSSPPAAWSTFETADGDIETQVLPLIEPLEPLETVQRSWSCRRWRETRQRQAWFVGGGLLAAVLLVALLLNVLLPQSDGTGQTVVVDKAGMVYIEPGPVQLGNDRDKVVVHLEQILAMVHIAATLDGQQRQLLSLLVDQYLEPVSRIQVRGFWIDRYEVTNTEYARFLQATQREAPEGWNGVTPPPGKEDHPVENIRQRDAEAFARWAGKKLPTSAQWTRAYRADGEGLFPWGDSYQAQRANVAENTSGGTTPVAATPEDVSPLGVYNLVGNVAEFVRERPTVQGVPAALVKGASYRSTGFGDGLGGVRQPVPSGAALPGVGFRCVVEEP
jgi:formylglycine-generating enzyme required for sulfatase activity/tRNA A-37 threonylcarbamoyl transferase component Bud32